MAHVTDGAASIALKTDAGTTQGTVIGADPASDLALVRSSKPLTGTVFALADRDPEIGDRVAAIGFPVGDPITLTQGGISGLDRSIDIEGLKRTGLLQTDAAVNPGNSGGPLLAEDGAVVGLVDALNTQANGIAYAVSARAAKPSFDRWTASPTPQPAAACTDGGGATGPTAMAAPPSVRVGGPSLTESDAAAIATAFRTYFGGINRGDYAKAYRVLGPGITTTITERQFGEQTATTYDSDVKVEDASAVDPDTVVVFVTFTSLQAADQGPGGDTCTHWALDYRLVRHGSGWLIDGATPHEGAGHTTC